MGHGRRPWRSRRRKSRPTTSTSAKAAASPRDRPRSRMDSSCAAVRLAAWRDCTFDGDEDVHRDEQRKHGRDKQRGDNRDRAIADQRQLLDDADAGGNEQQTERTEQRRGGNAEIRILDRYGLRSQDVRVQDGAGRQQKEADDWAGHRQARCAREYLAHKLADEQQGESTDHRSRPPVDPGSARLDDGERLPGIGTSMYMRG